MLSEFGCDSGCSSNLDLDGDNSITVADVLMVLSAFGEAAERLPDSAPLDEFQGRVTQGHAGTVLKAVRHA